MDIKKAANEVFVMGRNASVAAANTVAMHLWREEERTRDNGKGIAAAVFGTMNAILKKGGHMEFGRDEWEGFYEFTGLPKVTKSKVCDAKANAFLAGLDL